ncbi:MAG TPA: FAD-dependent oxidoreductase [Candidatus Binatia bacterium]|nr:FAD-dependent oxidoreductase [Candidatus Binatia bacterium]
MNGEDTRSPHRPKQVVVFGAGIAGLTAAHELAERGFEVDVYEADGPSPWDRVATGARCAVGGMAKTQWTRTTRRFGPSRTREEMESTEPIHLVRDVRIDPELDVDTPSRRHLQRQPTARSERTDAAPDPAELRRFVDESLRDFEQAAEAAAEPFLHRDLRAALDQLRKLAPDGRPIGPNRYNCVEVRGYCAQKTLPLAFDYGVDELEKLSASTDDERREDRRLLETRDDLYFAWKVAQALVRCGYDGGMLRVRGMGLGHREDWVPPNRERNFVRFTVKEDWLPGEHGFRFFPAFYRNLFDTMRRTPIATEGPQYAKGAVYAESSRTVLDNVIPTELMGMMTAGQRTPFGFRRQAVKSLEEIFEQGVGMLKAMGFPIADLNRFQLKLFKYMTSSRRRRAAEYENVTWWEFLEADRFSASFRRYLDTTAEALVAMNARKSDARTYGNVSVQMVQDQLANGQRVDGTLNGPTSVAWFDHWRRYLQHQGVRFHRGRLERFEWHAGWPWAVVRRDGKPQRIIGRDYYVLALPVTEMARIAGGVKDQVDEANAKGRDGGGDVPPDLPSDFERICEMRWGDPAQADPGGSLDHMAGIQFFFDGDVKILNGHVLYPDTPWRLSAVGQPQFWRAKRGWWSGYRGILSVDISNWHNAGDDGAGAPRPGRAWDKSAEEIARETWNQICGSGGPPITSASRPSAAERKPEELPRPALFHLDESIVFDRNGRVVENKSPLLINRAKEYPRRPGKPGAYALSFRCIALAGTYMQTFTRLTTMEAANESGRHAVNAILADMDFTKEEMCEVYDPEQHEPPDLRRLVQLDEKLFEYGLPHFIDILDLTSVPRALLRPDPDLSALDLRSVLAEVKNAR